MSPVENLIIAVPLRKADGSAIESETVLLIVHNLFGYEFSILIQFAKTGATFSVARNSIIGHIIHPAIDQIDWSGLPRSLTTGGYFRVVCSNPTAATSSIEPQCRRRIGSLMQLTDTYEVIDVLEISELNDTDLFVIFRIGTVVPRNFIDVPKMYFALWKKSNADSLGMGRAIPIGAAVTVTVVQNRRATVTM
jgi:hypothetical protein